MSIQANISNSLKAYRKIRELSQEALAEKLGVTSQAVSKWECMQSIPDIETVVAIAEMLEISTDKLLLGRDPIRSEARDVLDRALGDGENLSLGCIGGVAADALRFDGSLVSLEEGPNGTEALIKIHIPTTVNIVKKN